MGKKFFRLGDKIRCTVQGEYSINVTIEARISEIFGSAEDVKLFVKTSLGHKYLVHARDCELLERD
jgi:hypothetical protein